MTRKIITVLAGIGVGIAGVLVLGNVEKKDTPYEEIKDAYYALTKVIPNSGGKPVYDGYDGEVVRWDGTKEVKPKDLITEYRNKGGKDKESEKIIHQL